jgi:tetratricopeptide (TPR) repeat protein
MNMGVLCYSIGKVDDAIAAFQQALKIAPNFLEARHNLEVALQKKGIDPATVLPSSQTGGQPVAATQEQLQSRMNLAESLRLSKRYDEALAQYRDVLRVLPNNPVVYFNMGITYSSAGRIDAAISSLQQALKIAPDYVEAQRNLEILLKEKDMINNGAKGSPLRN